MCLCLCPRESRQLCVVEPATAQTDAKRPAVVGSGIGEGMRAGTLTVPRGRRSAPHLAAAAAMRACRRRESWAGAQPTADRDADAGGRGRGARSADEGEGAAAVPAGGSDDDSDSSVDSLSRAHISAPARRVRMIALLPVRGWRGGAAPRGVGRRRTRPAVAPARCAMAARGEHAGGTAGRATWAGPV